MQPPFGPAPLGLRPAPAAARLPRTPIRGYFVVETSVPVTEQYRYVIGPLPRREVPRIVSAELRRIGDALAGAEIRRTADGRYLVAMRATSRRRGPLAM